MTTGDFTSKQLLDEEQILKLPSLTNADALEIGKITATLGKQRKMPITIEIRINDWVVYYAALNGSNPKNDCWIKLKVAVVMLKKLNHV